MPVPRLSSTCYGLLVPIRRTPRIIIFGHSWGGTETVTLARELERRGIPVLLTIQVDSIAKPGQENSTIPANVENAVNFYQSRGLLHGRSEILAKDPARTNIIGNFEMTYKDHPINCKDFPWYSRVFTKSHIEIENDPRVWTEAASLIDLELSGTQSTARASLAAKSPVDNAKIALCKDLLEARQPDWLPGLFSWGALQLSRRRQSLRRAQQPRRHIAGPLQRPRNRSLSRSRLRKTSRVMPSV